MSMKRCYVTLGANGFTLRDPSGRTITKVHRIRGDIYINAEEALKECAKHTRGKVYVFCGDRKMVEAMNDIPRIEDVEILRRVINVKALENVFESVKFFYIQFYRVSPPPD